MTKTRERVKIFFIEKKWWTAALCLCLAAAMFYVVNYPAAVGASAATRASYADWSGRQTYLHCVTGHDAVDDAEAMYHRCLAFAEREEDSELRAELADLRDQLRLLAEMEEFSLRNVL